MTVNILAVGDVCGKSGLEMLSRHLPGLKKAKNIAFTVVNGENANIVGMTPWQAEEIFSAGADVITLGNHTWSRREIQDYLDSRSDVIRPANFAPACPGRGFTVRRTPFGDVAVINLIGRYAMDANNDNPFVVADAILEELNTKIILVDMHAEGTSERMAMGYYLSGRVSAVWGTHTHVQTSDACVLEGDTGYISDLGMTGPIRSVIGIHPEQSINKFLGMPPRRYASADGPAKLECAAFAVDTETGACKSVEALRII